MLVTPCREVDIAVKGCAQYWARPPKVCPSRQWLSPLCMRERLDVVESNMTFSSRGLVRAIKVGGINKNSLATPSTSLKTCYYPLPTPIFSSILRKSRAPSWQKWGGGQLPRPKSRGDATVLVLSFNKRHREHAKRIRAKTFRGHPRMQRRAAMCPSLIRQCF